MEREVLWRIAPHIIHPLRLVLPHHDGLRPAWLLRLGLFLYDHLGGRKSLPPTRTLDLAHDALGKPLAPGRFSRGFEYSDCIVDDARLVALNARDAADRGARILTRSRALKAERRDDHWEVVAEDQFTAARITLRARALVNAAGPWVENVLSQSTPGSTTAQVRLVQGSHIVVPKLYEHDRAYMFQNADGRIIFVIPYQDDFTLIGTTDVDYDGDPSAVRITESEVSYLCASASAYLAKPVTPDQIVWTYAGVRPLYDDGASEAKAATRDYVFELDAENNKLPLLSIFGGKITTYRRLAEEALERLAPYLPAQTKGASNWTATSPLPGGDFEATGFPALVQQLCREWPFLTPSHARRLANAYGTRARVLLGQAKTLAELGLDFGATLTEAEVRFLMTTEWARTAEDIVWRRSKLGLHLTAQQIAALDAWMSAHRSNDSEKLTFDRA